MKKLLLLTGVILGLVGCGNANVETVTVCSIATSYSGYDSAQQTTYAQGDRVTNIEFEGILNFDDQETLDAAVDFIDQLLASMNQISGIEFSYERLDDARVKNIARYDLSLVKMDKLMELGLMQEQDLQDSNGDVAYVSLKETIKILETSGMTCVTE